MCELCTEVFLECISSPLICTDYLHAYLIPLDMLINPQSFSHELCLYEIRTDIAHEKPLRVAHEKPLRVKPLRVNPKFEF